MCKPGAIEYVLNHLKKKVSTNQYLCYYNHKLKVELFYQRQAQQQAAGNIYSLLSPMTEGLTSNNTLTIIHQVSEWNIDSILSKFLLRMYHVMMSLVLPHQATPT